MKKEDDDSHGMHRRRVTLGDGRYLIFYTFGEEGAPQASDETAESAGPAPEATPQAEEERSV